MGIKRFIEKIESIKIPVTYWILTFFAIIILRIFLEGFLSNLPAQIVELSSFVHFSLFFISIGLAIIILLRLLTNEKIKKITKIVIFGFIAIILAPVLDFVIYGGDYRYIYLIPNNLIHQYLAFFGNTSSAGITLGLKIEVLVILIAIFAYVYIKTRSYIKGILSSFFMYSLVFIYSFLPKIATEKIAENFSMNYIYLFSIFIYSGILFYSRDRKIFKAVIENLRISRIIYYLSLFAIGSILYIQTNGLSISLADIIRMSFACISFIFTCIFIIGINDIEDIEIDKITNRDRPLVMKRIKEENYKKIGYIFLIFSLLIAAQISFSTFLIISLFAGLYFLYSAPPFKLKRIPLLSKSVIGLNSLLMVMMGFAIFSGNLIDFPSTLILLCMVFFTLCANFIDIKDHKGDEKAGIKTLPVIAGLKAGKLIISIFFLISYIMIPFIINQIRFLPISVVLGIAMFFAINKKDYKEKLIFVILLLSLFAFIAFLVI